MNLKELVKAEKQKREAQQLELASTIIKQFDFRFKIKRSLVQAFASTLLDKKINNDFCLYITACLKRANVLPIVTQHNRYYRHQDWLKKKNPNA